MTLFAPCEIEPIKVKLKFTLQHAKMAQKGLEVLYSLTTIFNLGARRSGRLTPCPGRFTPGKQKRHPMYRGLGRRQGRSERRGVKPRHPPGFVPRTIQLVADRYTDYKIYPVLRLIFHT
jgi:hypothetical protein